MTARHPLWRAYDVPDDAEIEAARVAAHVPETVEVVAPDPTWPELYAALRDLIAEALGDTVLAIEHVGSTSVPGLAAKAVIDVDVIVADPADEAAYVPALEAAGLVLRVREPEWEQHRCLRSTAPAGNVHVWPPECVEAARHRAFREWLRAHDDDRAAYAEVKTAVAAQGFTDSMQYNNAKSGFIYDLYERIFLADPDHPHDPQPR